MLSRIIAYSVRNKLIIGMMVLAMIGWGIYNVTRLPIDAVPDITNNQVLVITSSPSLGAADIERLITFPIEIATRNIPGIVEQRSFSRFGLSIITIVFDDKTDVYWARQQVSSRLIEVQTQIPAGLGTPVLGPVTTGLGEIFQYVLRPKAGYEGKYTPMELRTIQDWIVRRQLLGTPGVADISSFGGRLKQYEIAVDDNKLKSFSLSIGDLFTALEANNQNTGGAYIDKGPAVLFIRSEGLVKSKDDIENILVKNLPDGMPVLIKNVAEVRTGSATRYGAMCYNDQGEVAGAVVMMLKGENSSKVIKNVKDKIGQIQKTLPEGVLIEPFLDRTKMVDHAIGTVKRNLIEGALIVVLILVLFLGNLRAGLLVASIIPLSMLFAISLMNLFGVSGNLMSLGALDFGLIVDGAVIIVEATMHRLHESSRFTGITRLSQEQMDDEVTGSSSRLMNAAVFGQVIILIVYLPILSLQGIEGKMFKPMAQTVVFAIAGAFLLSLTYVPMMSSLVLSKRTRQKDGPADRLMQKLETGYSKLLQKTLPFPKVVIGLSIVLLILSIFILRSLGGEFIPKLEEGDFAVDTRVLTGSSLNTTIRATQQAAHILLQRFPEVEKVVTKIGAGEIPTDPMPMDASDMMVILKQKEDWVSAKTFDELAEKMSKTLEDVPGVTAGFQFPVQMRFNELMTGGRQDVICKIFGEDLDTLTKYATQLGGVINKIDGAKDLYVEAQTGLPQIEVNYHRAALAEYGLSIGSVNNIIRSAFAGAVTGQVYENERRFDLVVRLSDENRRTVDDVSNLLVTTSTGAQIPLQQVADVRIKVGPNQIQRENAQRRITVGFNVRGRDVQTLVNELQNAIARQVKLPPAYYITYGGQFENLVAAKQRLSIAVPISLLLIFIMLYFAFRSVSESLLIYTAIPLSAIGGIFSLFLRGMPFSISAGVGFIALFGIAVLNGIVLLTEFNQLEKSGVTGVRDRVLLGTKNRLRPVLMTASVASLGFLPMAISNGAGAEVQRPLATVVIGGLVSATLLTLVVLPVLYIFLQKFRARKRKTVVGGALPVIMLISLASFPGISQAQRPVSLAEALAIAQRENLSLQASRLQTLASKRFEKSAWDIPSASILGEYGQMNSVANDTRFSFSQSIAFPVVYRRQRDVFQAQTQSALLGEKITSMHVRKQVTKLFFEMLILRERERLLKRADTLYAAFADRQQSRFAAGDINITENTAAQSQRMQAAVQLQQVVADFHILQVQFDYLLNSKVPLVPDAQAAKLQLDHLPDSSLIEALPALQWKKQQQIITARELGLLKARRTPVINLGYSNQSLVGPQNINGVTQTLTGSKRFSSVIGGISFPLFGSFQKARIAAMQIRYNAAGAEYADTLAYETAILHELILRHEKNAQALNYYESSALKQSDTIIDNASLQLSKGSISYLEWIVLVNQAISLQAGYIDALSDWNNTIIELNSYAPNF